MAPPPSVLFGLHFSTMRGRGKCVISSTLEEHRGPVIPKFEKKANIRQKSILFILWFWTFLSLKEKLSVAASYES